MTRSDALFDLGKSHAVLVRMQPEGGNSATPEGGSFRLINEDLKKNAIRYILRKFMK